jgi:hypothetical protein
VSGYSRLPAQGPGYELARARRHALLVGAAVAVFVAVFSAVTSVIFITLGVLAVVLGVIFCLTVIGAVVGVPLIALGVLAIVGGAVGGSASLFFAVVVGAGTGALVYRSRLKRLSGDGR